MALVKRFLALNKDILTSAELGQLVDGKDDISINTISVIFGTLLSQKERKILLIVDEHGLFFKVDPPLPTKSKSLKPLSDLRWWREDAAGSRVIFTGTVDAKYEMTILDDSYRPRSVVFVGSLSEQYSSSC
ncbi:hypothetical protein EDD21DRAFT_400162 [Dissophora ornata]|nr:hypothetical protein EDD21DRAFT_400162 [Dissophora ornata]